jgi:hypothetical protein
MKRFEHWKEQDLVFTFGVKKAKDYPLMLQWLAAQNPIDDHERRSISQLQNTLINRADKMNEDELKFFFLGPFISLVRYEGEEYTAFAQRPMSATVPDLSGNPVELKGRVEFMVATGFQDPVRPYFFFHEYKQERRIERDPLGQVLSAMLAAQALNHSKAPLYGCYVVGRFWFFVVLDGKKYAVSNAYDATSAEAFDIFSILREARKYVEAQVSTDLAAGHPSLR